jgi:hypothetical protein
LLSCYWIVPALLSLGGAATGQLSAASDWAWTETRSQIANAFWLNTNWAWQYPQYFPFAARYGEFPLVLVRYFIPATAFAAVPLTRLRSSTPWRSRLAIAAAGIALFFVVLATGTLWPGRILFDPLYSLPLGWLLREPGRLLFFAGLAYAILVSITADSVADALRLANWSKLRARKFQQKLISPLTVGSVLVAALVAVIAITVAPLATGSFVASSDTVNIQATAHITVPKYWTSMPDFINHSSDGELLMMPPDDFYQMPYTWGYYGADGFIGDMITKKVVDPNSQGYFPGQSQLISTVNLIAQDALTHRWSLVDKLLAALGTNEILLRGDVSTSFPGRTIMSPVALSRAFSQDPYLAVAHRDGPLLLFNRTVRSHAPLEFETVDSATPNLTDLSILPRGTALVTSARQVGVPYLVELNPNYWTITNGEVTTSVAEYPDWTYKILTGATNLNLRIRSSNLQKVTPATSNSADSTSKKKLTISFSIGKNLLTNGNFSNGLWEARVGDCLDVGGPQAFLGMRASVYHGVGPGSSSVLQLSTTTDTSCESQRINWSSGSVLLSVQARNRSGAGPRLCLYAIGPNTCIPLPAMPATPGWSTYRVIATPPSGTVGLGLFLYSSTPTTGVSSVNQYANIAVYKDNITSNPIVKATPKKSAKPHVRLIESNSSYSSSWAGPANGRHVLIDGMRNGWLIPLGAPAQSTPHYTRGIYVIYSALVSAVTVFGLMCASGLIVLRRYRRRYLDRHTKETE